MKVARTCLMLAGFLAPLVGGHVSLDAAPAEGPWLPAAATGASWTPYGTRLLLLLLVLVPFTVLLFNRRVGSFPRKELLLSWGAFLVIAALSTQWSSYTWPGLATWPTIAAAGGTALLAVAVLGRKEGPHLALDVLVAGAAVLAVRGIMEYAAVRASEPGYRIFSGWNNPNGLASMLALAFPVGLARAACAERVRALGLGAASVLIGLSLVLTQSKGGLLAVGAGLFVGLVTVLYARGASRKLVPIVGLAVLSAALGWAGLANASRQAGAGPGRLVAAQATAVQSEGFRKLLWRSASALAWERKQGWGLGSFRFLSARPGLTPMTYSAHNSLAQARAETGFLGEFAVFCGLVAWFWLALGGIRHLPVERKVGLAGCVGAIAAVCAHGYVETNFGFTGVAFGMAYVMGCGLCLSNDGTSPERMPRLARIVLAAALVLPGLLFGTLSAVNEAYKASAMASLAQADRKAAKSSAEAAFAASLGMDGESQAILGQATGEKATAKRATELLPIPRTFRLLATLEERNGNTLGAISALERGLSLDPKNLAIQWRLVALYDATGNTDKSLATAQRLVAIEKEPYFTVRAIPELVPTETYQARVYLANREPGQRAELLRGALEGFRSYFETTLPMVRRFEEAGFPYLGETTESAQRLFRQAKEALAEYREEAPSESDWAAEYSAYLDSLELSESK